MIRKPNELIEPIREAVDRKAVVFSHVLIAITISVHTVLDPRSFGYQIALSIGLSIAAIAMAYFRFFDLASLNSRPRLYLIAYYLIIFLGFVFISDAATPYITGFFLIICLSNLYYGHRGVWAVVLMLAIASIVKYPFLLATTDMTTIDKLNIVVTFLIFLAVASIFINIQKVYDWDRQRLKVALEESDLEQKRLNTLINNMTESVLVLNNEGIISLYNAAALGLFDTNTPLTGRAPEELIQLEDAKGKLIKITELLPQDNKPVNRNDIVVRYGKDDLTSLSVTITPLKASYGQNTEGNGFIMTARDITREKSLEEERNEFISVISHELRTPVTVAEASLSNALLINSQHQNDDAVTKSLKTAHDQSLYLASMLNDLSTFARAEQDELELDLKEINPHALINQLRDDYQAEAENKGLRIEATIDHDTPPAIISSPLYIREILQNFITNAIKYSDKGVVTIKAKPSVGGVKFSISDEGIGISKSDQGKVFDKFFRTEDFRTRSTGGTGLGLYIVRKLAKLIHATFELQSEIDQGSTFSLIVPDLHTIYLEQRAQHEKISDRADANNPATS